VARTSRAIAVIIGVGVAIGAAFFVGTRLSGPAGVPDATPSATLARGGELIASFRTEPTAYNRYVDRSAAGELVSLLTHATLVRVNRTTDTLEPWLAESWTESGDGLAYTLKLRPDVTFSDGAPFTSADVLFSFAALYDPRVNAVFASDTYVNGTPLKVEAPDASTVVVRFAAPFAPGLRLIEGIPIFPRHKLQTALDTGQFSSAWSAATTLSEIAGLGPFVLAEHVSGQRLVFARNPRYWRRDAARAQLPYLDKLTILIVPDQNTEALRMQAGEIDLMGSGEIRPEDYSAFKRIAEHGRLRLLEAGIGLDPTLLWFNLSPARAGSPRHAWFQQKSFRQGVSCAADRQGIVNTVHLGAAVPLYGPITPANRQWYSEPRSKCDHDLVKARELFALAGLTDRNGDGMLDDASSRPVRFSILTQRGHSIRERTVAVLQEQLRQVGLAVDIVTLDPPALFQRWSQGDYDSIYFGIISSTTDPALNPQFWLSSGNYHLWNPEQSTPATDWERRIDELFRQQAVETRLSERQRLVAEAVRIMEDELPAVYFTAPKVTLTLSLRVANPQPASQIPQLLWSSDTLAVAGPGR
jgi:peptide/nickel transport system substrate-binding protein